MENTGLYLTQKCPDEPGIRITDEPLCVFFLTASV